MLSLLKILGILLILIIISFESYKLGKRETTQTPIFLEEFKDGEAVYCEQKYVIYKVFRGWVLEMEDTKNAVACHSRIDELNRGENLELEFKWDFNSCEYVLTRKDKVIDSTDDFY